MITCDRFDNCKRAGIIPERVRRGYDPCRNRGIYTDGPRKGKGCYFIEFPHLVDLKIANARILAGETLAHELARARRSGL